LYDSQQLLVYSTLLSKEAIIRLQRYECICIIYI
jgi:hypothetical protein